MKVVKQSKIIAIYYRDLPAALVTFLSQDAKMTFRKDGVSLFGQLRVPRATIEIERTTVSQDAERVRKLLDLLTELESNNQIVGYSA